MAQVMHPQPGEPGRVTSRVPRVVLAQEPAAGWILLGRNLHHSAADGEDVGELVQVADPQLGQFSPAQAALDVGLHQQPGIRVRQGLIQEIEFGGGNDPPRLLRDRRRL